MRASRRFTSGRLQLRLLALAACIALVACSSDVSGSGKPPPAVVDPFTSSVVIVPAGPIVASGTDTADVVVTVRDATGKPVANRTVQLSASGSGNTLVQPGGSTNGLGVAIGTLASTAAETKTITALVDPGPKQVLLAQAPAVDFVGDPSTISTTLSTVSASPSAGIVANGSDVTAITVTVRDAYDNPVGGQVVELAASGGANTLAQPGGATGAAGVASGTLASTLAETKTVSAVINPGPQQVALAQQPAVDFVGDPSTISAVLSTVDALPGAGVIANGVELSLILVGVRDAFDNPVAGQTVQLAASGGANTLTQPAGATDAFGLASGSLSSTLSEIKTVDALVNPGPQQVAVAQQPTVEFVGDPSTISATLSTLAAVPSAGVIANGSALSTLTATVRDAFGNPVAGQTVALAATGGANTLVQPGGPSDAAGVATGTLASILAETKVASALINPGPQQVAVAQQPAVAFVGDPSTISATLSSVAVSPSAHVAADGVESASITVTLRDANSNPVAGRVVELSATGAANSLVQPSGATDAGGQASGWLASTAAEQKTVSALVDPGPGQIGLADQPAVGFDWIQPLAFFVRQSGQDPPGCSGGTTPATAWRTLSKAAGCAPSGATVHVGAGTYVESVSITSSGSAGSPIRFVADVTGEATGDAGPVSVDAAGAGAAFHLDGASWIEIQGFTLTGASGPAPSAGFRLGDGACSDVVLRENVVYGCSIGIHVRSGARVAIEQCSISNSLLFPGRGIVLDGADDVTVLGSLVYNNAAEGIAVEQGASNALVRATTLYANAGDQVAVDGSGVTCAVRDSLIVLGLQDGLQGAPGSTLSSDHNDAWGQAGLDWNGVAPASGDFSLDPQLVDPAGADGLLGGAQSGDDRFQLSVPLGSPAFDVGSASAAVVLDSSGFPLSHRTSRLDELPDGCPPDGAIANLGFHYPIAGAALPALETGDVRLFYGEGTQSQARTRTFDASAGSWGPEQSTLPTQATVRWACGALSPLASEDQALAVLCGGATATRLDLLGWTGAAWKRLFASSAISPSNVDKRGFDLAYEAGSGDLMVVYSTATSTPTCRVRSAGVWSAAQPLPLNDGLGPNPDPNTGAVLWVELAARPGSDEIALAYADGNADLVVIVWDGSQWLGATAAVLALDLTRLSGALRNRCFDLAYESATGDLMAAWGRDGTTGFWWAEKSAASAAFGAAAQVGSAPGFAPNVVDLAPEPGTARIALCAYDLDSRERYGLATWDGASWLNAGEYDNYDPGLANTSLADLSSAVAWLGTTGTAISVYPDNAAGTIDWARWTAATGWAVQPDVAVAGKGFTDSVRLCHGAGSSDVVALLSDSAGKLFAASYDGSAWSVVAPELESGLSASDSVAFDAALRD